MCSLLDWKACFYLFVCKAAAQWRSLLAFGHVQYLIVWTLSREALAMLEPGANSERRAQHQMTGGLSEWLSSLFTVLLHCSDLPSLFNTQGKVFGLMSMSHICLNTLTHPSTSLPPPPKKEPPGSINTSMLFNKHGEFNRLKTAPAFLFFFLYFIFKETKIQWDIHTYMNKKMVTYTFILMVQWWK